MPLHAEPSAGFSAGHAVMLVSWVAVVGDELSKFWSSQATTTLAAAATVRTNGRDSVEWARILREYLLSDMGLPYTTSNHFAIQRHFSFDRKFSWKMRRCDASRSARGDGGSARFTRAEGTVRAGPRDPARHWLLFAGNAGHFR